MIYLKSDNEIKCMIKAGNIAGNALKLAGQLAKPGISTKEIDKQVHDFIIKSGATPSFLNYGGFPCSICTSINNIVIHGIPSDIKLKDGDILSVDVGACIDSFHGDCANTFAVGNISDEAKNLIEVTRQSFFEGLKFAIEGNRIGDISNAIQKYAQSFGYGVVEKYVGHGIGKNLHEDPAVPNYGKAGFGLKLKNGLALAIEPMINQGTSNVTLGSDNWSVYTADAKLSAHFEHTVIIYDKQPILTTQV